MFSGRRWSRFGLGRPRTLAAPVATTGARTGSPWRDLPPLFGKWNRVFKGYRDWVEADVFKQIFDATSSEPDREFAMVDATIVKVHRHGQGGVEGIRI